MPCSIGCYGFFLQNVPVQFDKVLHALGRLTTSYKEANVLALFF